MGVSECSTLESLSLLEEMLKCSKGEGMAELEEALATMLNIIKSVNDSMHQIAITGFDGNLSELGKLLMQGSFNVWTDHKKGHSKVHLNLSF
ncbi:guanine nucleotide exchange factor DBS [Ilyodon furcidens]|uniref:Guanine nucleotide exchange factor DBS n=1 Tax=Ilyodon furcidens TaxID=33524 RepID=A0ABV0TSU3_9TELE